MKEYLNCSQYLNSPVGFGTTLVLKKKDPWNSEGSLRSLVFEAREYGNSAGLIIDPTYPIDFELTDSVTTVGYILLDKDNDLDLQFKKRIMDEWELY